MKNGEHFLKKIDYIVFGKIDLFIQSNLYQKYTDFLKSFSQEVKVYINKGIILSSILIPVILLMTLYISNRRYENLVEIKREISILGTKIIKYRNNSGKNSGKIIGTRSITNKNDLDSAIRNIVNGLDLNLTNVQTKDFTSTPKDTFNESFGTIAFNKLTTKNLFDFLYELTNKHKFKIDEIKIERDRQLKLLSGSINFLYYSLNNNMTIEN